MYQFEEDFQMHILTGVYALYAIDRSSPAELDLGCGAGSYALSRAEKHPERMILAADVMIGRLRKVVKKRNRRNLANLEVLRVEARTLVSRMLPDGALDVVHILCPDPWPKDRHRGHRLVTADFLSQLHRILKPGTGIFHFSSDDEPYFDSVLEQLERSGIFESAPEMLPELTETKSDFEMRWLEEGKTVRHLAVRPLPRPVSIGH
ncbi:MAG: methyltransferase domain-containing protein [Victivallaceae bacterium]|nr:methyltransferase domain-containing protein [Victivallaceae bacterium]